MAGFKQMNRGSCLSACEFVSSFYLLSPPITVAFPGTIPFVFRRTVSAAVAVAVATRTILIVLSIPPVVFFAASVIVTVVSTTFTTVRSDAIPIAIATTIH